MAYFYTEIIQFNGWFLPCNLVAAGGDNVTITISFPVRSLWNHWAKLAKCVPDLTVALSKTDHKTLNRTVCNNKVSGNFLCHQVSAQRVTIWPLTIEMFRINADMAICKTGARFRGIKVSLWLHIFQA